MKPVLVMILFVATFTSRASNAWAASLDGLTPIAFTQFRSNMPDNKASRIAQSLSLHLRRTFVEVYATETIGNNSAFSPNLPPAILGSSGYALGEMDRTIDLTVMPELRPVMATLSENERIVFTIDILWAEKKVADRLPQTSVLASALIAAMRLSGHVDAASLLSLRWVNVDEGDPSGALRASLRKTAMLQRLNKAMPGQWLPWDTSVRLSVDRSGIVVDHKSLMLPSGFVKNQSLNKPGMFIDKVAYAPHSTADEGLIDLARVSFKRFYSVSERNHSSDLRLSFGVWGNNGFQTCEASDCLNFVNRVPTIHGKVVFAETSWWSSLISWFRSWVVSEISTQIMLKDLRLNYDRDSHRIAVDPSRSMIPIIVTSDALFSGGRSYVLDDRSNVFGVNLYERFVGSQITDGLSADLNNSLAEADKALAELIGSIAGGVVR